MYSSKTLPPKSVIKDGIISCPDSEVHNYDITRPLTEVLFAAIDKELEQNGDRTAMVNAKLGEI